MLLRLLLPLGYGPFADEYVNEKKNHTMARKSLDGKDVWSALLVLLQRPGKNSGLPWDGKLHGPSLIFCILNMIDIHQYVRQGQQQALGGYWIGFGSGHAC